MSKVGEELAESGTGGLPIGTVLECVITLENDV